MIVFMRKIQRVIIYFSILFSLHFSVNVYAEHQPFSIEAFNKVKQQHQGKQWLTVLWSVDCPPCFKELALIQKMRKTHKNLAIVIINADDNDEVSEVRERTLANYELDDLTAFNFIDGQASQNRYSIDPAWYGELPRSYFIDDSGFFHGKSGLLDDKLIRQWLLP